MLYLTKPNKMRQYNFPKKLIAALILCGFIGCQEAPKEDKTVVVQGNIEADTTWTADKNYVLDQQVTVPSGVTLTIEPGTVIKANAGEAPSVSMLVVARGGKIMAKGTAEAPIIFTSINDNLDKENNIASALNQEDVGLWGGIIILGNAPVSLANGDKETFYVGLDPNEKSSYYGGDQNEDNSGEMEYVSIRHGGIFIGTGSESNGLTLCGVGANTKINHLEIYANQDDGIELFGGSVNVSNLIVHASGDDAIDIDEGYTGTISNFLVELTERSDNALEISGGQGESAGAFTLSNGTIDGGGLEEGNVYSIDEKAEGKINNILAKNVNEGAAMIASNEKVTVEKSEEQQAELNFDWARARQK